MLLMIIKSGPQLALGLQTCLVAQGVYDALD